MAQEKHGRYVLDSYALIGFLEGERGADLVRGLLEEAVRGECVLFMSVINLGEVLYIVERERGLLQVHKTLASIAELPLNIVDADLRLTLDAAHLKAGHALAYADCFAAALAWGERATLVTGDPEFKKAAIDTVVSILWID